MNRREKKPVFLSVVELCERVLMISGELIKAKMPPIAKNARNKPYSLRRVRDDCMLFSASHPVRKGWADNMVSQIITDMNAR